MRHPEQLDNYDGPIHVRSSARGAAKCVLLKDGRYHVYQRGTFPDLLNGPDFILASGGLVDVLRSCGPTLKIAPVVLIDLPSERKLADYYEVKPEEELTPQSLEKVDAIGTRAWHFRRGNLFVTQQVALVLQRAPIADLKYSSGFSEFIGI